MKETKPDFIYKIVYFRRKLKFIINNVGLKSEIIWIKHIKQLSKGRQQVYNVQQSVWVYVSLCDQLIREQGGFVCLCHRASQRGGAMRQDNNGRLFWRHNRAYFLTRDVSGQTQAVTSDGCCIQSEDRTGRCVSETLLVASSGSLFVLRVWSRKFCCITTSLPVSSSCL